MTTEIEKQFFNTFGIEPKSVKRTLELAMQGYDENDLPEDLRQFINSQAQVYHVYPEITDRILLELICILSEWRTYLDSSYTIKANNTLHLKQDILKDFLELFKWYEFKKCEKGIKQQVRTLFEEG